MICRSTAVRTETHTTFREIKKQKNQCAHPISFDFGCAFSLRKIIPKTGIFAFSGENIVNSVLGVTV